MTLTKDSTFRPAAAVAAIISVLLLGAGSVLADTLYITTTGDSTIKTYNTISGAEGTFTSGGKLAAPQQLAFDGKGVLYVASPNTSSVLEYTGPGSVTAVTSSNFKPAGIAVTSSGDTVYAGSYYANTIYSYDPADAAGTLAPFISTGLNGPTALALSSEGTLANDLFVANAKGNDVLVYDAGGTLVSTFTGFNSPYGLAFDGAGDLYVSNAGAGTVEEVPAALLTKGTSSLIAAATLGGLNSPRGLAFDSQGNLYVAEYGAGNVDEINSTLTVATPVVTGLDDPAYLAVPASPAVPEPSAWTMWMAAGAGLGCRVLRQRRARA